MSATDVNNKYLKMVAELENQLAIVLDEYYLTGYFDAEICHAAEKVLNKEACLNDEWYIKNIKPKPCI